MRWLSCLIILNDINLFWNEINMFSFSRFLSNISKFMIKGLDFPRIVCLIPFVQDPPFVLYCFCIILFHKFCITLIFAF